MKIIVPYTDLSPATKLALKPYGGEVQYCDVSGHSDSYYWLLKWFWSHQQTIIIVEHDIVVWPGALEELWNCPGLWCSNTYEINEGMGIHHAFGCTKLSGELMKMIPDVWDRIEDRHWSKLDAQLCHEVLKAGQTPHPHRPAVMHMKRQQLENV